jgi:hypothetical protein
MKKPCYAPRDVDFWSINLLFQVKTHISENFCKRTRTRRGRRRIHVLVQEHVIVKNKTQPIMPS